MGFDVKAIETVLGWISDQQVYTFGCLVLLALLSIAHYWLFATLCCNQYFFLVALLFIVDQSHHRHEKSRMARQDISGLTHESGKAYGVVEQAIGHDYHSPPHVSAFSFLFLRAR